MASEGSAHLWRRPAPRLLPTPTTVRGFRIRLDLLRTKPPVWRRIEVPGDITLPRLHDVIQAAMGWTDSHLHQFLVGNGPDAGEFITQFDVSEGVEGMLEDGVRLDQVLASEGDRLRYTYDFGDNWDHVLRVEKVLETPPSRPICVSGKLACPPEDCGSTYGYEELAAWVRGDYSDSLLPEVFESREDALDWLPPDWHPDVFDIDAANQMVEYLTAEPVPVVEELASLLKASEVYGSRDLNVLLAKPAVQGPIEVSADDAAELTEPFRVLLDVIGEGVNLTNAGYLKPADVQQIAQRSGVTCWWIGMSNREDITRPVAILRALARSLGLISVRKGRVSPTQAAKHYRDDLQAILHHIIGRLPLGKSDAERQAGWMALAVAASETPMEVWAEEISFLMYDLGWRGGESSIAMPPAHSPTLEVLHLLCGVTRHGWRFEGVNPAVAAVARAALRV